jgi:hypothetical protein
MLVLTEPPFYIAQGSGHFVEVCVSLRVLRLLGFEMLTQCQIADTPADVGVRTIRPFFTVGKVRVPIHCFGSPMLTLRPVNVCVSVRPGLVANQLHPATAPAAGLAWDSRHSLVARVRMRPCVPHHWLSRRPTMSTAARLGADIGALGESGAVLVTDQLELICASRPDPDMNCRADLRAASKTMPGLWECTGCFTVRLGTDGGDCRSVRSLANDLARTLAHETCGARFLGCVYRVSGLQVGVGSESGGTAHGA